MAPTHWAMTHDDGMSTAGTEWRAVPTEGVQVGLMAVSERRIGLRVSIGS